MVSLVGLTVAAVVAIGITTDFGMVRAYRRLLTVAQPGAGTLPVSARRLSAGDRLVLEGDPARGTTARRQRAIWEAAPTNRVYYHNYLSTLLVDYDTLGTNAVERYGALVPEIEAGRAVDPDNARLDFIQAAKLLEQAVESKTTVTGVTPDGKAKVRSEQVIKDRAKLVDAMAFLEQGLRKPVYHRYVGDMLAARLAILGAPRSLSDQMLRLNLAADTPMPDLPLMRSLSRGAGAYAALLIGEHQATEARPFLEAWKPLAVGLTRDSFALIDVLMAAAIVKEAELRIPELYEQIGMTNRAREVRADTLALTTPLVAWNTERTAFQKDPAVRQQREAFGRQTGILATMLLPALTVYPSAAELAPSRSLDYILMEDLFFAVLSILMLVVLVAGTAWLPHLRKTLTEGGQGDGGSLWRKAVLRTAWCVVIPVLVYFVLTRFTAFGGRLYGVPYLWPRLLLQLETLAVTMVLLDRYLFSSGSAPHPVWRARWLVPVGLAGLAFLLPVDWLTSGHKALALTAMSVPVAILILTVIWLALRGRRDHRPIAPAERYERRAVALLALGLSVLVLTLGARGVLRLEERQNVRQEALLKVDPSQGGFTVAEAKLARTLRDQVLKAAQAK